MVKAAINDDVMRYRACMDRITNHLRAVEFFASSPPDIGCEEFSEELIAVHFRKALEDLAFCSLSANVDAYSKVHAKFASFWQAKGLMEQIGVMNPHFYPIPLDDVGTDYVSQDEFFALYKLSSGAIHSRNPYSEEPAIVMRTIAPEWIRRFRNLLRKHSIRLIEHEETWVVVVPEHGPAQIGVDRLIPNSALPETDG
jgi:hypothetical protein